MFRRSIHTLRIGLLDLKVCSFSILGYFFSKQKLDEIGFFIGWLCVCPATGNLTCSLDNLSSCLLAGDLPLHPIHQRSDTPTGLACELKDVDTTGRPVPQKGMSAGAPAVFPVPKSPHLCPSLFLSLPLNMWQNPLTLSTGFKSCCWQMRMLVDGL